MNKIIKAIMPIRSQVCRVDPNGITQPLINQDNHIDDSFTNSKISTILKNQGLSDIETNNCIKKIIATAKRNRWNIDKIIEGLKWINSQAESSEGIIVTNNSIKYGIYTYKNHMGINGFRSNLPNSPIIFGELKYHTINSKGSSYFKIDFGRVVEEGTFEWISQVKDMALVDGKVTNSNGNVEEGKFEWISQLKDMALVDGKETFFSGNFVEGKFEYNTKIKKMVLVEGKATINGIVRKGKFEYNTEFKSNVLVVGKVTNSDGVSGEGKHEYNTELDEMVFVKGTKTFPNGDVHEGEFEYNSALNEIVLVEGTKKLSNVQVETGIFEYNTELKKMVLVSEK